MKETEVLTEVKTEFKHPLVSHVKFIRSKLSHLSAHVSEVSGAVTGPGNGSPMTCRSARTKRSTSTSPPSPGPSPQPRVARQRARAHEMTGTITALIKSGDGGLFTGRSEGIVDVGASCHGGRWASAVWTNRAGKEGSIYPPVGLPTAAAVPVRSPGLQWLPTSAVVAYSWKNNDGIIIERDISMVSRSS